MARSAKAAAETLVHYIKLAIGPADVRGDMHGELQSVIDDFAALDAELEQLRKQNAELDSRTIGQMRIGGRL